jgi:hypothetical protein
MSVVSRVDTTRAIEACGVVMSRACRQVSSLLAALAIAIALTHTAGAQTPRAVAEFDDVPSLDTLLRLEPRLKPELADVHPRVFVTASGLNSLRERAKTTHKEDWRKVLASLPALQGPPPPPPGPQARRSQNNAAYAISSAALAYAVEQEPAYFEAARAWMLAAIDYEPWGYTYNKPNVDLAAGHLLYAIGWAYDLLYSDLSEGERTRVRASLERHAGLVYAYFAPGPGKRFNFTQNHDFIPTAGLGVAALALMGESADAPKWAALARAHHHRANQFLSPDGYYYESMEYWIFSIPWLVHFYDAWEHSTGESLWELGPARNWKHYLAHVLMPDQQSVFDFGDIWEGPLTRAKGGAEYERVYPGGTLQSNFNVLYRVASRFRDPEAQAVAERYARAGHSNLEEYWTLLWRDPTLKASPMTALPLTHHFEDSGVVFHRTSWEADATAVAFKAGPPEGHRVARLLAKAPEWRLDSGHAHPDAGSFIIWAGGRYLTGDTGYAGLPQARQHNTITVGGIGQGVEGDHNVWRGIDYAQLDRIRITAVEAEHGLRVESDLTAAYPTKAGLTRFHRVFAFDAVGTFTVTDSIALSRESAVQWYLQSDSAPRQSGQDWIVGGPGTSLRVTVKEPAGVRVTAGPTLLMAPGQPGSITKGAEERRGHHLQLESAKAASHGFVVVMTLEPSRR